MAEYIVGKYDEEFLAKHWKRKEGAYERIVRCKDCKRSWVRSNGDVICRHRRFGLRETEFDLVYVEPYGFCAWGERRQDD